MRKNWCERIQNPKASAKSTPSPPKDTVFKMIRKKKNYDTSTVHLHFWNMYIAKQITAETLECALILMDSLYGTLFGTTA